MAVQSIRDLPREVREEITDEKYITQEERLYDRFQLDGEQIRVYCRLVNDIFLGRREVRDFLDTLAQMPDAHNIDLRGLALATAVERFWPVSFYLKGVDLLINRLGGRVPASVTPKKTPSTDDEPADEKGALQGSAKALLQQHRQLNDLYITQKPIKDADGRLRAPTVNNWLTDYLHAMGASGASALKRSQYLAKSANAQRLNDAEKKNLLNFLASYEDGAVMYWRSAEGGYLLIDENLPEEEQMSRGQAQATSQLADLLGYYRNVQDNYEKLFAERTKGIEIELSGSALKISDIIWDSLGLQDVERCLAACDLAIDRRALWDMLKTDQRYRGIVGRYIDAHYNVEAKAFWDGDLTTALGMGLLWRVMFVEKLGMEEGRAAIVADYFSKKLGQKTSPIYLDLKNGTFLFRDIAYRDKTFNFV